MQELTMSDISYVSGGHVEITQKDKNIMLVALSDHQDFFSFNDLIFTWVGCFNTQGLLVKNDDIYSGYRVANPMGYSADATTHFLIFKVQE